MKKVLVTGSRGFIGRNLMEALKRRDDLEVLRYNSGDDPSSLATLLEEVDFVYHLAGVNRPPNDEDYETGNAGLTAAIVSLLRKQSSDAAIVFTSSTQALESNPYGSSKRRAEDILIEHCQASGAAVFIYRLTNVFGKWCRPNYNSVVATFCYNISHGLDISISSREKEMDLVYIDDIIKRFVGHLDETGSPRKSPYCETGPIHRATLGELADRIHEFRDIRTNAIVPDLSDPFTRKLYATFLSYLDAEDELAYDLDLKSDERGSLAEIIKSRQFGQFFISKTGPGVVRGNHSHDTKIEKFIVIEGDALIKLRRVDDDEIFCYRISGNMMKVVDIPPGYTHSIENLSDEDMIVLFWADQIFDPENPDTYFNVV